MKIIYKNIELNIIKIKKGTILFRVLTSSNAFLRDYYGKQEDKNDYCLSPQHNVFFYNQPFIVDANLWLNSSWRNMLIYEIQYDIELLDFTENSKYLREDEILITKGILRKCNDLSLCSGLYNGIKSDYCLTDEFLEKYPNIMGLFNIVKLDNIHLKKVINKYNFIKPYIDFFKDKNGFTGIPELSIYPLHNRVKEHIITPFTNVDLHNNIIKNIEKYNYIIKEIIPHQPFEKNKLLKYLKYKLKFKNKFYYLNKKVDSK